MNECCNAPSLISLTNLEEDSVFVVIRKLFDESNSLIVSQQILTENRVTTGKNCDKSNTV